MATKLTSRDIDPAKVYIAWQSFGHADIPNVIQRGTRLRGNDKIVQKCFQNFVEDGTPESEWPNMWDSIIKHDAAIDAAYRAEQALKAPPEIPADKRVIATETFRAGGRTFAKGQIYDLRDKVVRENKNFFAWPPRPLA